MSTGAVAARAAGREVQGGYKDEGVVPVAMHLEETRFLQASWALICSHDVTVVRAIRSCLLAVLL